MGVKVWGGITSLVLILNAMFATSKGGRDSDGGGGAFYHSLNEALAVTHAHT